MFKFCQRISRRHVRQQCRVFHSNVHPMSMALLPKRSIEVDFTSPYQPSRALHYSRVQFTEESLISKASQSSVASPSTAKGEIVSLVDNTGSVARDHLAAERTFLAWARTGMTFVALGIGLESMNKIAYDVEMDWILAHHLPSMLCVATGGIFVGYATHRFYAIQRALMKEKFPINRFGLLFVVISSAALTMGILVLQYNDDTARRMKARNA